MARVNDHYLKLRSSYLFTEIAKRVKAFQASHPDARIIRLGIGDVTQPLPAAVVRALHEAVDEMAKADTFRGYGPEPGVPTTWASLRSRSKKSQEPRPGGVFTQM